MFDDTLDRVQVDDHFSFLKPQRPDGIQSIKHNLRDKPASIVPEDVVGEDEKTFKNTVNH